MIELSECVEIGAILVLFYGLYLLSRSLLSNRAKRFTLLTLPLLATLSVLIKSYGTLADTIRVPVVELSPVTVEAGSTETFSNSITLMDIYFLGVLVMILILAFRLVRLLFFFRKAIPYLDNPKIKILLTDNKDAFSFFNRIHLCAEMDEEERKVVLEHEVLHFNKLHSLDLILVEIYHALFWFNPILIFMKKELVQVHEFEVDEVLYRKYDHKYLSHLLSYSFGTSVAHLLLTSQFYRKMTLANRIKKMKNERKSNHLMLLLFPIAALCLALTSWTYVKEIIPASSDWTPMEIENGDLDKNPEYKGGKEALFAFIGENVKYPKTAEEKGIEGTVHVGFNVEATGAISDVKIVKGAHELLDAEAKRVVAMMPNWIPGEKDGKVVKTQMTLPIKFKLKDN